MVQARSQPRVAMCPNLMQLVPQSSPDDSELVQQLGPQVERIDCACQGTTPVTASAVSNIDIRQRWCLRPESWRTIRQVSH